LAGHAAIPISEPALLFYPRPIDHRLEVADQNSADVLCASVRYDAGMDNAITQSLPVVVVTPFREAPGLEPTLALLFEEAGDARIGRQVMLDRLCDVLLIQIVRHAIARGLVASGLLAGLAHPRLENLLIELLDGPGKDWPLEVMAARAHLSRNAFARLFKEMVGVAPAAFLTQMRIGVAQRLLRKGRSLTRVAEEVGYGSQPAFSRAFMRETGLSPSAWVRQQAEG
jgi:AraC-like DNA-binding protein